MKLRLRIVFVVCAFSLISLFAGCSEAGNPEETTRTTAKPAAAVVTATPEPAKSPVAPEPAEVTPAPPADGCRLEVQATESRLNVKKNGEDGAYEKVGTVSAKIAPGTPSDTEAPPAWPRTILEGQGYKPGAFADELGESLLAKQLGDGFLGYADFDANDTPARAVYVVPGMETSFKFEYAYTRVCK